MNKTPYITNTEEFTSRHLTKRHVNTATLYHADCSDGLLAAYAMKTMNDKHDYFVPKATKTWKHDYIPMGHHLLKLTTNELIAHLKENFDCDLSKTKILYVVDFSLTNQMYIDLLHQYPDLTIVVLDHHKSAMDNAQELNLDEKRLKLYFNMKCSGAVMAYAYMIYQTHELYVDNPKVAVGVFEQFILDIQTEEDFSQHIPMVYKMIEDRDLWKFKYTDTKNYTTWFYHNIKTLNDVEKLVNLNEHGYGTKMGAAMNTLVEAQLNELMSPKQRKEIVVEIEINGQPQQFKGYIVNANSFFVSDLGSQLCRIDEEHKFAIVWQLIYDNQGNPIYKYGLRSTNDFDCSIIAKYFGGGGHPQASGIQSNTPLFQ